VNWRGWQTTGWRQWAWDETDWQRWPAYQRAAWSRCDRLQVFTPRDAAAVKALAPHMAGRVRINPFGLALPPPADHAREVPGSLVFVGGFSHRPNVDAALWLAHDILPALRARCPGVQLTLVGSEPPPAVLALAGTDVKVTGRVAAVEPYLEQAAVVLAPLRIGGGMRMKVLQGMALGKAVVTTPLGAEGLTQVAGPPPLALAGSLTGLVEATAALLADAPARRALGQRARAFVAEHYSPAAYARRTDAIYHELLAH
jgi:glycosyltransferase involved in cell wall biosynthesis